MSHIQESGDSVAHRRVLDDERQELILAVARLQGEVAALRERRAGEEVAEQHLRAELDAARLEAAEARAAQQADQARVEELRRTVSDLRTRLEQAEETRQRAENERAAVIAALGRKARRLLPDPPLR